MPTQEEINKFREEDLKIKREMISKMPMITLEEGLAQLKRTSK